MDLDALAHIFASSEVNMATNPRFEAGALALRSLPAPISTPMWSLTPQSGVVSDRVIEGAMSLRLAGSDWTAVGVFPAAGGQPVSLAADVGLASTPGGPRIVWYGINGAVLGSATSDGYQGVAPETVAVSSVAPPFTAWCVCQLAAIGDPATSATFDRVIASLTPQPVPFFDGDSGACAWAGARYWSTSRRLGAASELDFMIELCAPVWSSDSPLVTAQPDPVVPYS